MTDVQKYLADLRKSTTAGDFAAAIPRSDAGLAAGKADLQTLRKQRQSFILDAAAEDDLAKNAEDMRTLEADLSDLEMAIAAAGRRHEEATARELVAECERKSKAAGRSADKIKSKNQDYVRLAGELTEVIEDIFAAEAELLQANRYIIGAGQKNLAVVNPWAEMARAFGHPVTKLYVDVSLPGFLPLSSRTRHYEKITHYIKTGEVLKPPADKAA